MDSELLLELVSDDESVELVKEEDGSFSVYNTGELIMEDGEEVVCTRSRNFDNVFDAHAQFCEYAEGLYEPYQAPKSDDFMEIEIIADDIDEFAERFNKFLAECGMTEVSNETYNTLQALEDNVGDEL